MAQAIRAHRRVEAPQPVGRKRARRLQPPQLQPPRQQPRPQQRQPIPLAIQDAQPRHHGSLKRARIDRGGDHLTIDDVDYDRSRPLGSGGFGAVHRFIPRARGVPRAAVKMFEGTGDFREQANAVRTINQSAELAPRFVDCAVVRGRLGQEVPMVAMTQYPRLARRHPDPWGAWSQVRDAMRAVRASGLVYFDLKLDNLYEEGGRVKVGDLGGLWTGPGRDYALGYGYPGHGPWVWAGSLDEMLPTFDAATAWALLQLAWDLVGVKTLVPTLGRSPLGACALQRSSLGRVLEAVDRLNGHALDEAGDRVDPDSLAAMLTVPTLDGLGEVAAYQLARARRVPQMTRQYLDCYEAAARALAEGDVLADVDFSVPLDQLLDA